MCWPLSDGPSKCIPIDEEPNHQIVHAFRLGKAQRAGRVPTTCGYCFETSPVPSASSESAGHKLSKPVLDPSSTPVSLYLSAPQLLHTTILNRHPVLDRLRLRPRRHPVEQYLFERPHVLRQSRCHRGGTRPPHLRRTAAVGCLR